MITHKLKELNPVVLEQAVAQVQKLHRSTSVKLMERQAVVPDENDDAVSQPRVTRKRKRATTDGEGDGPAQKRARNDEDESEASKKPSRKTGKSRAVSVRKRTTRKAATSKTRT
jgi:hypothetical protein